MEIQEILKEIKFFKQDFPYEAAYSAELQKEEITPHLLNILQSTVANYENISDNQVDYLFALFLLSKFKEQKAFPLTIQLASLPGVWPEKLLGDFITESLTSFFVSTFNGDFDLIKQLIENQHANEWSRLAALKTFLGLFALNRITREAIIDYLKKLFHSPLAQEESFMTALVSTASDIYPEELLPEIEQAFEQDRVDYSLIDEDWVKDSLNMGKEKCLQEYIYNDKHFQPVNHDVTENLSELTGFLEYDEEEDIEDEYPLYDSEPTPSDTYVRSQPKIGRNDPCICGSGKKYKKCCLN
jgi:hypothetical protein